MIKWGNNMELASNDFGNNQEMPSELTCDGQDVSPHLRWGPAPDRTESFAIVVDDVQSARRYHGYR